MRAWIRRRIQLIEEFTWPSLKELSVWLFCLFLAVSNALSQLIIFIVYFLPNCFERYKANQVSAQVWKQWLSLARPLLQAGLIKESQISRQVFNQHFHQFTLRNDFQYQYHSREEILQLPTVQLPRLEEECDRLKKKLGEKVDQHFIPPLVDIVGGYWMPPDKLDLCADDLEYYFLISGLIELKIVYVEADYLHHHLQIFYRGYPLLLTCPNAAVIGHCKKNRRGFTWRAFPGAHDRNCTCGPFIVLDPLRLTTTVSTEMRGAQQYQLEKNIYFLRSLKHKLFSANSFGFILEPSVDDLPNGKFKIFTQKQEQTRRKTLGLENNNPDSSVVIAFSSVRLRFQTKETKEDRRFPTIALNSFRAELQVVGVENV